MSSGWNFLGNSTNLLDNGSHLPVVANLSSNGANFPGSGIYPLGGPVNRAANPLERPVLGKGPHP